MTTTPRVLARLGRDTGYVLTGLPLATLSFSVLVSGVALAAGLAPTLAGLPVGAAVLGVAAGLGRVERGRLRLLGDAPVPAVLGPVRPGVVPGVLDRLADPRRWAAVAHAIGALPLTLLTWTVTVTWWALGLGGATSWIWSRFLPSDPADQGLADLLGLSVPETVLHLAVGVVALATLPAVVRACALAEASWARLLLTEHPRPAVPRVTGPSGGVAVLASAA